MVILGPDLTWTLEIKNFQVFLSIYISLFLLCSPDASLTYLEERSRFEERLSQGHIQMKIETLVLGDIVANSRQQD